MGAKVLTTIKLKVDDTASSDRPVFEEVLVERLGPDRYRLLKSPGLVAGLAADDEIEIPHGVGDHVEPHFRLIKRGRNVCVQMWAPEDVMVNCAQEATDRVHAIGGRVDGMDKTLRVFTIPVEAGFPAIERIFFDVENQCPGTEWIYGNVYDPSDDKTPLNWWL